MTRFIIVQGKVLGETLSVDTLLCFSFVGEHISDRKKLGKFLLFRTVQTSRIDQSSTVERGADWIKQITPGEETGDCSMEERSQGKYRPEINTNLVILTLTEGVFRIKGTSYLIRSPRLSDG